MKALEFAVRWKMAAEVQESMSEYLFAYGTLAPGLAPDYLAAAVEKLCPVGEGVVHGVLYDLGHYPGAVLDPSSKQEIIGTVFQLPEDASILPLLDDYEEFDPDSPESSQFVRKLQSVELAAGLSLECWMYVYNRAVEFAPILAGGRFPI